MYRSLHEDAALALLVSDQVRLARSQRRRELRDQLLLAEGATARVLTQDAGRRARQGAAVVGAASLLLAPGMTGVAAAADPPEAPPVEETLDLPAPQAPDDPVIGLPDDDPAPTDPPADDPPVDDPAPTDPPADDPPVDDPAPDDPPVDPGNDPTDPEGPGEGDPDEDDPDEDEEAGGVGQVIEEVGAVIGEVLPGEGGDDRDPPGQPGDPGQGTPPETPPGQDDGDDDGEDEIAGEIIDEVVPETPASPPPPPARPPRPRPTPPARPAPVPQPAPVPAPTPPPQPADVVGAPDRVDPARSPQQVAAPVTPQAQTAPPVRTAVDPAVHPNLAPTPRLVGGETSLEERVLAAQARPVDAVRVDDWSRAVIDAWTRMQAGDVTEPDDIAVFDEVAEMPTLGWSYEIRPGDSLWTISEALWGTSDLTAAQVEATWQLLYTWNAGQLGADPDTIPSGAVIQIPIDTGA